LTPVDMNAVTIVGAPFVRIGVHMWNGTADTLNAKPTASSPTASSATVLGGVRRLRRQRRADRFDARRARQREGEGDAVKEERAREAAEQENT
jgi:hypothetical protein